MSDENEFGAVVVATTLGCVCEFVWRVGDQPTFGIDGHFTYRNTLSV